MHTHGNHVVPPNGHGQFSYHDGNVNFAKRASPDQYPLSALKSLRLTGICRLILIQTDEGSDSDNTHFGIRYYYCITPLIHRVADELLPDGFILLFHGVTFMFSNNVPFREKTLACLKYSVKNNLCMVFVSSILINCFGEDESILILKEAGILRNMFAFLPSRMVTGYIRRKSANLVLLYSILGSPF